MSSYALAGVPIPGVISSGKRERDEDSVAEKPVKKNVSTQDTNDNTTGRIEQKKSSSALSGLANYDDDSD